MKHTAIDNAMKVDNWNFKKCIVFSKSNLERNGDILYLPWYMIIFYREQELTGQMIYEVDLSGLLTDSLTGILKDNN